MRRFFTITGLCAILALFLIQFSRNETVRPQAEKAPAQASDVVSMVLRGEKDSANIAESSGKLPAPLPTRAPAIQTTAAVQADAVAVTSAHIPSSAPANEVEQELAKLSLFDLKATVQKELARLGCYGAKIDGRWGGKSQAAVKAFNERSGANWGSNPTAKLAKALRGAPAGLCKMECKAGTQGAGCAVAAAKPAHPGSERTSTGVTSPNGTPDTASSYLPPRVSTEKLASADPNAVATLPAGPKPTKKQAAIKKKQRKQRVAQARYVERQEPRPAKAWTVKGWPRSTW